MPFHYKEQSLIAVQGNDSSKFYTIHPVVYQTVAVKQNCSTKKHICVL